MAAVNEKAPAGDSFGHRLIPNIIDELAHKDPQRECFSIPRSSRPEDGWRAITFKEYANAINFISHMIIEKCGYPPHDTCPTLVYLGSNDARYVILLVAAVKAGYKALFISPRNSREAQMNLFNKTDCRIVFFSTSHRTTVEPWLELREMKAIEVDPLDAWFPSHELPAFPYNKTFEQAEWTPLVVLHTSGSTGLPKPVIIKQGMLAIGDAYHDVPDWDGRPTFTRAWSEQSKRQFAPFPLFHAGGLYLFMIRAIYWGNPVALGIVERPLSPDLVVECLDHLDVEGILLPPAILEQMSQSTRYIQSLVKLKMVIFGGIDVGNKLIDNGVVLVNAISTTEFSPFPTYVQPNPKLWQYFIINSKLFGADWRKLDDEDDLHRLVIARKGRFPGYQGCFYTFPDLQEYDTKDLYKPHPTVPLNPTTIEELVECHPFVRGALVFGSDRFQPGLLIEPTNPPKDKKDTQELIDSVWAYVVRANEKTVSHGQIAKTFLILSDPRRPLPCGGKGSIQRASAVKLYKNEIDRLYEKGGEAFDIPRLDEMFQAHLGVKRDVGLDTDFFSLGIDSLQVINTSRLLHSGLRAAGFPVDAALVGTRTIYANHTPRRLASHIYSLILQSDKTTHGPGWYGSQEVEAMELLWKKYTADLPKAKKGRQNALTDAQTVMLTGSNGMLGSQTLDRLIKSSTVKRIVCLNRAKDGGLEQQKKAMTLRKLETDFSKCTFLHADMGRSAFGLSRDTYNDLLEEADRVFLMAWPVNFNIPLESFEPQLRGIRNVADFASKAAKRVSVIFVSSVSTCDGWDTRVGPVPEKRLENLKFPNTGYGRSKMVASLILEDVAEAGDFSATIVRVGQIAGPEIETDGGLWNKHEWVPSIIASSLFIKALPGDLAHRDVVDWVPIERIVSLVLDVAGGGGYFHGVNPATTSWTELAPAIQEFYGKDRIPQLVSFQNWVAKLEESQVDDAQALEKNPAIKLLDFYRELAAARGREPVAFDTERAQERSLAIRNATAVTPQLMKHWCEQWGF
ncbi:nonribosomal peptide synthetase [Xylariaceae sp. FL0662B]|nr:nonribosomal peptide synthetase [Xylariaceae sp. FL0662B]